MINIATKPTPSIPNRVAPHRFDNASWRPHNTEPYAQSRNRSAVEPAVQTLAKRAASASAAADEDEVKIPTWAVSAFGTALAAAIAVIGGLVVVIFGSVTGDIKDLKTDVKEARTSIQALAVSVAEVSKQAAVTNARLDATNEKLQILIDETRKRR
ncbi:Na+(H+)/acetate symporter ActP [Bosea sp. BE271]|uniref:hypothetical protein n=1 Tax=Bosea TaxID=85413 RepID=UPI00285582AA|nr:MULTISPECIES: hypothetical protein [Bosea]MDR7137134.1 Na+(H+)/acetate symporter ActP [Bosea sp. BE168]MDR7173833.1 Na+(H+)/acetate symporter ActP [Bosea sp. BE271]